MKKLQLTTIFLFIALFVTLTTQGQAQSQEQAFGLDAIRNLVSVSSPAIAPDGSAIAIIVSRPDYETNNYKSELVLVDVETGDRRVLTPGRSSVSQPAWSLDGTHLGFLSPDENDVQQL